MKWSNFLRAESKESYFNDLAHKVLVDAANHTVYPARADVFKAFDLCAFDETKVVILAQDPYHGPGQAHGLAFSVPTGIDIPPSLRNIFKELEQDIGCSAPTDGNLSGWARQGVLLLNSSLTVRKDEAGSHSNFGWHVFTDRVISLLNDEDRPLVFILWGSHARKKKSLLDNPKHLIIESVHPSPLSAYNGFFGSKPFSKTNYFLKENNLSLIDWQQTT